MRWPGDRTGDSADDNPRTDLDGNTRGSSERAAVPFHVRQVEEPLGMVLILAGELDVAAVPLLQEQLDRVMCSAGGVVIDLAGLEFVDSSGLEVLVRADQQLRASGGQLLLLGGSHAVYRVFELAGVDHHFEWCDSPSTQTAAGLEVDPCGAKRP